MEGIGGNGGYLLFQKGASRSVKGEEEFSILIREQANEGPILFIYYQHTVDRV